MIGNYQRDLHFHPERIVWVGLGILSVGCLLSLSFLWKMQDSDFIAIVRKDGKRKTEEAIPYSFSLAISKASPGFSIPDLKEEMTFSFDPPRPTPSFLNEKAVESAKEPKSIEHHNQRLLVRLKRAGESKKVTLPCRIDLEFQKNQLRFAKGPSLFWMDLALLANGEIEAKGWITSANKENIAAGCFRVAGQECPLQTAHEFIENTPFHLLAEAKWWGRDLFRGKENTGERIELADLLELGDGDWLVWKDEKWQKGPLEKDIPIARIQSVTPKMLVLEGWDQEGHVRIGIHLAQGLPFKIRGEDIFSSIRARSEKQISCMLEKQCMVLKTGDWVLKTNGKWKILRKKDERNAFLNGQLFGELFILERISQKQGQKVIQGRLFNPGRTQVVEIELPTQTGRKLKSGRSLP